MRAGALLAVVALCSCVHATPRATVLGQKVALGELRVVGDLKGIVEDALRERFELVADETAGLHLHVDASLSGFDQPVFLTGAGPNGLAVAPRMYRRVETLRATLRLVNDATGEEAAVGIYELTETGPERLSGTAGPSDELATILARRAVRTFIDEKKL